jgi:hypothetical protein
MESADMSESAARAYISQAAQALKGQGASISPAEKVLIYASLAQAEATLETVDLLRSGIVLRQAEELTLALGHLARKLPDR